MAAPSPADRQHVGSDELLRRADALDEPFSPEIVLFLDGTDDSKEARSLLEAAGESYHLYPASGMNLPAAACGGIVFECLAGIRDLVVGLAVFDAQADVELKALLPQLSSAANGTRAGGNTGRKAAGFDAQRANDNTATRAQR